MGDRRERERKRGSKTFTGYCNIERDEEKYMCKMIENFLLIMYNIIFCIDIFEFFLN